MSMSTTITIYRQSEAVAAVPVTDGSTYMRKLMSDDYITLKFSLATPIVFRLGDWCDTDFGRFEVTEQQKPDWNTSTGGYDYELKLEAEYMKWKNKIFMYRPESGGRESSWTLTAKAETFMELFLANLEAHGFCYKRDASAPYSVVMDTDADLSESKCISFDNTNLIDALTAIADEWECEWWVEGQEIHLGKCQNGTEADSVEFESGTSCESIKASDSSDTYATRIYVFGGTTNIPSRYRKILAFDVKELTSVPGKKFFKDTYRDITLDMFTSVADGKEFADTSLTFITGTFKGTTKAAKFYKDNGFTLEDGTQPAVGDIFTATNITETKVPYSYFTQEYESDITKSGVVETHLMLPTSWNNGKNCIDAEEGLTEEEIVEDVVVFDDIYPKTECETDSVEYYETEVKDENTGEGTGEWTRYYLIDDSSVTLEKDWILPTVENFSVLFLSGMLSGMEFQMNLLKEGDTLDGRVRLSDGTLGTFKADKQLFHLIANEDYGRQLPDTVLYPQIGDTFVLRGYDADFFTDMGQVSKAESELLQKGKEYVEKSKTDPSTYTCTLNWWAAKEYGSLQLGQRVLMKSDAFFTDGQRLSRVIGFEIKLDKPYDAPEYTVGESVSYSRLGEIEDRIDEITTNGSDISGSGSGSVYIIKSGSSAIPTDNNVYSAKRSDTQYLHATEADEAEQKISFLRGQSTRGDAVFYDGLTTGDGAAKIDADGAAELLSAVVRTALSSPTFVSGFTGEGWRLWLDGTGLSELELDKLTVRQTMRVFELIIDKIRSVGGQIIVSAANGKVKEVSDISGTLWKLTMEDSCQFKAGDLIRCQTFTGEKLKSYWVEVTYANTEFVFVRQSDFDDGVVPEAGDEVVLMGNVSDEKRQNLISISATDDGQPRIDVLNGVKGKSLDGCLRARLGNLDGIKDSWFGALDDEEAQPHGDGLYADNAYLKGTFVLSSGEDVKTKLEATDGKIESTVEGLRDDVTSKDSYLNNPTFAQGLEYWGFNSSTVFYMVGDLWVWADEGVLAAKGSDSEVTTEDRKCVARIIGGYIRQKNADMRMLPTIEADSDGRKNAVPFYVSFLYKCTTAGTLKVYFSGVDKTGFEAFDSLSVETKIDATTGWKHVTYSGMWNGTGDFVMEFSGEINVSMVILTPNEAETFYVKYKTFFEQSDKLVKIAAKQFNADGSVSSEGEIITTAAWSGVFNTDNTLKNTAGLVTATDFDKFEEETEGQFKTVTENIEESARTFTDWKSGEYASDQSKKLSIADFSSLFASAVDSQGIAKTAQLSSYVAKVTNEKTGKTELESGVLVLGDNIDLRGYTKINDYFQVDTDGKMHAKDGEFSGKLTATEGKIGDFSIDDQGLYSGAWTSSSWNTTDTNTYMHFYPGQLQLQKTEAYGTSTVAKIRVGIGAGADPDEYDKTNGVYNINGFCKSALYIYRRMNDGNDKYYPAAKILSDNVYNRDVALYTEGAVVCRGGVLSSGYVMDASEVTEIDFSRGDTVVVVNSAYRQVYLPPLATMQSVMQSTDAFVVRVTIIARYDNSEHFFLSFEDGESTLYFRDNDGGKKGTTLEMSAGDALQLALIWDGTNYYGQVLRFNT